MPPVPAILDNGTVLADSYVVERSLGGGGMGHVYLARDLRLDRLVAIKLLHAEVAANEDAEARFRREAHALSRVLHPNVVGIHAFGRHGDSWFLVMEFVEGQSLEQLMASGPMPLELVLDLTRQVAAGLSEAHALGIVHRDIKPGNVLVRTLASGGLLAKVADFGLARSIASAGSVAVTRAAEILGTPAYMSPEQIQAQHVDGKSDLYSLAVMVYQMLTGQLPYARDTVQAMLIAHLIDEPPQFSSHVLRSVPPAVERELRKALAKKREERHADVLTFARALERAGGRNMVSGAIELADCPACLQPATPGGFCTQCGSAVPGVRCSACGTEAAGERYACDSCGASLLAWPSAAGALVAGLRESSVVLLAAELAATGIEAQADRAALFATAVAREGGRLLALVGGEAYAVFGMGGMRDGDAVRAVDAALAFTALAGDAGGAPRAAVEIGVVASRGSGVAWGVAMLGGPIIAVARDRLGHAQPGGVVIGDSAYREARGVFEFRHVPRVHVRHVLRRRDASLALADYMAREVAKPFVGRNLELNLALRACKKVRREACLSALVIVGPPEAGKSRLVGEMLRSLEEGGEPWRFELVRCSPVELTSGWQPFADLVRDAMVGGEEQLAVRLSRLPGLQDADPERAVRRAQALMRMLGLDHDVAQGEAPTPAGDAEIQAAFEAWAAIVRGLCAQQPMALVIEDLQYARPVVLQLLAHIARSCEDVPLCLVLPLRSDRATTVLQALHLTTSRTVTVEVEPLEESDTETLVAEMLEGLKPPVGLVSALQRFAEGLPGRVEQALDTLMDEQLLVLSDVGWKLSAVADVSGLLDRSLQDLLMRRIGRLAPADRCLLEAVAVAGGSAPHGMLSAMLQRQVRPADTERMRQTGMLVESRTQPFAGHREWQLRPETLTLVLLNGMLRSARVEMHQRAAQWLELWPGARPPTFGARLAHHHLEAGDVADAVRHLLRNAGNAVHSFATRDGYDAYTLAADVATGWFDSGDEQGRHPLVWALVGQAETGLKIGELPAALAATARIADLATDAAGMSALRIRARCLRGQVLDSQGNPEEALHILRAAVDDARRRETGFGASVFAVSLIAMVLLRTGRAAEAEAIARRALDECEDAELANDNDLSLGIGRLHTWLGHAHARKGDHGNAQSHYVAGRIAFLQAHDELAAANVELSLGNLAWRAGKLAEAEDAYRKVGKRFEGLDDALGTATALANLGNVLLDQGRAKEALDVLRESERTQRRVGRLEVLAETLRLQGLALKGLGLVEEAKKTVAAAQAHAERTGQSAAAVAARETLGKLGA